MYENFIGSKLLKFIGKSAQFEPIFAMLAFDLSRLFLYVTFDVLDWLFNPFIKSWCEHVDVALGQSESAGFCTPQFHGGFYLGDNAIGFIP